MLYEGVSGLPHFNPDDDSDPLPGAVADLRSQIRTADAVLLSTPEYAGALPGSFKNLLDWTIGDDQPGSIYQKPVAWVNVSAHGAVNAHESLRKVLRYATAEIIEEACAEVVRHPPDGRRRRADRRRVRPQSTCCAPRDPRRARPQHR